MSAVLSSVLAAERLGELPDKFGKDKRLHVLGQKVHQLPVANFKVLGQGFNFVVLSVQAPEILKKVGLGNKSICIKIPTGFPFKW